MTEHAASLSAGIEDSSHDYADQRAAPRVTLLIRPAKLGTVEGEFVCVIRDVSATGISLRLFHAPPVGQRATLETETGQTIAMERVWARDKDLGFRFLKPIDVGALVSEAGNFPKRKLRLAIELDCDRRVLATGVPRRRYGEMLIDVAARCVRPPLGAPAGRRPVRGSGRPPGRRRRPR